MATSIPKAVDITSKLSNFLPLGCLCSEDSTNTKFEECEIGIWQDNAFPQTQIFEPVLASSLSKLYLNGWVRLYSTRSSNNPRWIIFRVYLLYSDIGLAHIDRSDKRLLSAVENLIPELDICARTWNGHYLPGAECRFDPWATRDHDDPSLFYLFNQLPSPSPTARNVQDRYASEAVEDLLDHPQPPGLKTVLYKYQRRSAAAMLCRESSPSLMLDPRLEQRTAPDGTSFYYSPRLFEFLREPRFFEACRGGILAETMGLGKTVICLALILATKNQPPKIPVEHIRPRVRPTVASLADMAASTANQNSMPWRIELERLTHAGDSVSNVDLILRRNPAWYELPILPIKWNRKTKVSPPKRILLASTTLIVVPQNLCKQWQSEIVKHVQDGALRLLVMDDRRKPLPSSENLSEYDIVLFTRNRFDLESKDGEDDLGRRIASSKAFVECRCSYIGATRIRDCHCVKEDMLYDSPLKHVHFKRLIVDEGHFFSNSNTNTASVADKLVRADHRWSITGTPARDLLGAEVDISAMSAQSPCENKRSDLLELRQQFSPKFDRVGAIDSLGALASNFLKVEPWHSSNKGAAWKDCIFRHEGKRPTYSGFAICLRTTLREIIIKTRPEDVEQDIELPPLRHNVIRLAPSFYDKVTANLFTLVLTANAVTSERTDADYLFHASNRLFRARLVSNLRQSAFFWTGFSELDVCATIKSSMSYLAKENPGCSPEDRELLRTMVRYAEAIIACDGWKSMSRSHELGVFIKDWPENSAEHWNFGLQQPVMTGISQLCHAQNFVDGRLNEVDPGEGLAGEGIRALTETKQDVQVQTEREESESQEKLGSPRVEKPKLSAAKSAIPLSSISGEPSLRKRVSFRSPTKKTGKSSNTANARSEEHNKDSTANNAVHCANIEPASEQASEGFHPYAKARILGTASAKMSYLISQILKYSMHEKILIFYQGDNVAYYIAQVLDLLNVKHEIYAKSLPNRLKSEYVVKFDQGDEIRVLLMDVGQAAFGLNLSSASRIYFVNPVCQPNVEAQAIKRAHRIGQTREVSVETLVLQSSIEEKMLERSKRMTTEEHRQAKELEDDSGIRDIIQSARPIPVTDEDRSGYDQIALIEQPEPLWGRSLNQATDYNVSGKRKRSNSSENGAMAKARRARVTFAGAVVQPVAENVGDRTSWLASP